MREVVKVTYDGIEITYIEGSNVWTFELRGRERSVESLAKAKEVIDKPDPKEKKPFTRIAAYLKDYSGDFVLVEVTSIAEPAGWSSGKQVWISGDGRRQKKDARSLYRKSPANEEKILTWRDLDKQREILTQKMQATLDGMETIEVEP